MLYTILYTGMLVFCQFSQYSAITKHVQKHTPVNILFSHSKVYKREFA